MLVSWQEWISHRSTILHQFLTCLDIAAVSIKNHSAIIPSFFCTRTPFTLFVNKCNHGIMKVRIKEKTSSKNIWIAVDEWSSFFLCNEVFCTALFHYIKAHVIIWYCIYHSPSRHSCLFSSMNCSCSFWQELHLLQGVMLWRDRTWFCLWMFVSSWHWILIQCNEVIRFVFIPSYV